MSEENKAIVRRQEEELFTQGNLDAADEVYAPDYVGHDPSNLEDIQGLEAAKQAAADYRKAFPDLRVSVEDVIAEGDKVAVRACPWGRCRPAPLDACRETLDGPPPYPLRQSHPPR